MGDKLTHFDGDGRTHMVDVSAKDVTARMAKASGFVSVKPETLKLAMDGPTKKGDVRAVAELAGIMGAKKTSELIPLCHPLPLSSVKVRVEFDKERCGFSVQAVCKTTGQTGIEMEALTAVSIACLTIYDMLKAADKGIAIGEIKLQEKTGGKSGHWTAPND